MRDITLEDTFYVIFTSRRFSTGAPFTLAGTPAVAAYEDNSDVQITSGVSISADVDSTTGLNRVTVVATAANGFENGKSYHLVLTAGTVDSVSVVGEVVGEFTIGLSAAAVDLANATDGLGAIKAETSLIVADTNELQTDDVPGLIAALNDPTAATIADAVWDEAQADHVAAGSFGLTASEIADILADTNELQADDVPGLIAALNDPTAATIADAVWDEAQADHVAAGSFGVTASEIASILVDTAEIGAAGAGLTAVPWNASWDAEVQSEVNDALVAFFTSAANLVDLIWDEAQADHVAAGSFGEVATEVASILADTNELQSDDVPGLIATAQADLDILTGADGVNLLSATQASIDAIETDTNSLNDTKIPDTISLAAINAEVDTAFTTQMADSVSTDGTIATREQALYMILQFLTERKVSGTTVTVEKVDGTTDLFTLTLDDGTDPTTITRAS